MNLTRGTIEWPAVDPKAGPWLWGSRQDLVWVVGLGSLVFGAVAVPLTIAVPALSAMLVTAFVHLGVICNHPHYAVTYQLIWRERGRARSSYLWLLWSTPMAIALVIYAAFFNHPLIGLVNRVYLTWSAYHYAAQHFGIASMYQAREKRPLAPIEKRAVQIGFVGVALYIMLLLNMRGGLGGDAVFGATRGAAFNWMLPASAYSLAVAVAAIGVGAYAAGEVLHKKRTGAGFGREARLLFAANFAWFVLPYVHLPGSKGPWIGESVATWLPYAQPFFHCAQYLAVCGWRARTTGAIKPVYYFMTLVAIGLLLFEAGTYGIGAIAGLDEAQAILLVPAVINIHHFFLDGLMWKARRRPAAAAQPVPAPAAAESSKAAA